MPLPTDEEVRRPLWEWAPADRPAILRERRRRFGMWDEQEFDWEEYEDG